MDYVNIGRWFTILHRRSQLFVTQCCQDTGLSFTEYVLLIRIYDAEGLSQEELASVLYLDKAVVTRSLTLLEQKGLIRRDVDARDRRIRRVYLTEYARTQEAFFQGIIRAWVQYLAAGINAEEVGATIQGFHDAAMRACEVDLTELVAKTKKELGQDADKA